MYYYLYKIEIEQYNELPYLSTKEVLFSWNVHDQTYICTDRFTKPTSSRQKNMIILSIQSSKITKLRNVFSGL